MQYTDFFMKKIYVVLLLSALIANQNAFTDELEYKRDDSKSRQGYSLKSYYVAGAAAVLIALAARAIFYRDAPAEAALMVAAPLLAPHDDEARGEPHIAPPKLRYAGDWGEPEPQNTPGGSSQSLTPRGSQSSTPRSNGQLTPRTLAGMRVLLVDDNRVVQAANEMRLRRAGSVVQIADNANEAVELAVRGDFDVVLMDNEMPLTPGRDQPLHANAGLEATAEIKRRRSSLPVIMHSSNAIPEVQLSRYSADGQIVKGPTKTDEYIEIIHEVVDKEKRS
jgi:CheY-like chemotaxis protein